MLTSMQCLSCGETLDDDSNYCPRCGIERTKIIRRIETFPAELKRFVDIVLGHLNQSDIESSSTNGNGELKIMSTGDVLNVPESMIGSIYTTGSVSFAPTESYSLDFYYNGELLQSAIFKSTAVIHRNKGDDKNIAIYTDQGEYHIRKDKLNEVSMRDVSRKPIVVVKYRDKLYICCSKEKGYLRIDGLPITPNTIQNLSVNQRVDVNRQSSIIVKLA